MENPSGVGTVGNAKCGDIMRMYLDIDDNGIIQLITGSVFLQNPHIMGTYHADAR